MNIDAAHMTSLFENATEGIILTNGAGNIVLMNPAARRMFGYGDDVIEKPIEVLIPAKVRPHHAALREGFYEHPQNRVMGHGRDLYGLRKDGTEIPLEVSLSFYTRDNEFFVIAFVVDITHRKKIEQSILTQQKELEKMTDDMRRLNLEYEIDELLRQQLVGRIGCSADGITYVVPISYVYDGKFIHVHRNAG